MQQSYEFESKSRIDSGSKNEFCMWQRFGALVVIDSGIGRKLSHVLLLILSPARRRLCESGILLHPEQYIIDILSFPVHSLAATQ